MNDEQELKTALRWMKAILGDYYPASSLSSEDKQFMNWIDQHEFEAVIKAKSNIFVVSLTEQGDLLSQWRAYCPRSGGYSFGLPGELLRAAAERQGWYLAPCIYERSDIRSIVGELIEYHFAKFRASTNLDFVDRVVQSANALVGDVLGYGSFVKDQSFEAEEEWRLVKTDWSGELSELRFAPGSDGVRVFLPFSFLDSSHASGFPSKPRPHIYVGPNAIPESASYPVARLLETLVGVGNADLSSTSSSYR